MPVELKIVELTSLPPAGEILSDRERAFYETLRFPKRRMEWLGGRFALKQLVAGVLSVSNLKEIEVLPQPSGKPSVTAGGEETALAFSITHSHGYAVAAVSADEPFLGIDLEKTERRIDAWAESFFHPSELTGEGDSFLTALWTQKEALVKLLGTGLSLNSFDVRCVDGVPSFFGPALEEYSRLGSPVLTLKTMPLLPGFMFTQVSGRLAR